MSQPPINMLWVTGELPWYAKASIRSFLFHDHAVDLYTYENNIEVPTGCKIRPADCIIPKEKIFVYADGLFKGQLTGFSDWFRYELLLQEGGWWSDSDVICQRPFSADGRFVFAAQEHSVESPHFINNNVMYVRSPQEKLLAEATAACRALGERVAHCETGPQLLTRLVADYGLSRFVVGPHVFNPIHPLDVKRLLLSRSHVRLLALSRSLRGLRPIHMGRRSYAFHLYSSLLQNSVKTEADIPPSPLLHRILRDNGTYL